VTGFTGITAPIDQVNANSISFKGTTVNPPGTEWSVHGIIDRITGSLDATVLRSITGGSYSGGGSSIRALGKCIDPKQARG